jgi:hypothetical protein
MTSTVQHRVIDHKAGGRANVLVPGHPKGNTSPVCTAGRRHSWLLFGSLCMALTVYSSSLISELGYVAQQIESDTDRFLVIEFDGLDHVRIIPHPSNQLQRMVD